MKIKIKSKKIKNKFIYGDFFRDNKSDILAIFLSGFSGSKNLPLFDKAPNLFSKEGFDVLKLNFCNDSDDKKQEVDAFNIEDMSFSVYTNELKNVIDSLNKKYSKIIFVGHSFGAVISIIFLAKNKRYISKSDLVLWEQSHLPWNKKEMDNDFIFDKSRKLFVEKGTGLSLNKIFYKELVTVDTLKIFESLKKRVCIIASEGSADKDAKKYFLKIRNKKTSKFYIIKNSDHFFKGLKNQKEVFERTIDFLKNS
jgi:alpha/beta superfamily hydrolase